MRTVIGVIRIVPAGMIIAAIVGQLIALIYLVVIWILTSGKSALKWTSIWPSGPASGAAEDVGRWCRAAPSS